MLATQGYGCGSLAAYGYAPFPWGELQIGGVSLVAILFPALAVIPSIRPALVSKFSTRPLAAGAVEVAAGITCEVEIRPALSAEIIIGGNP